MELDAEEGASFEQLQDLIKKECDKRDKNYCSLEQKYNKFQESFEQSQQKSSKARGQGGASNKRNHPKPQLEGHNNNAGDLPQSVEHKHKALDKPTNQKEKQTIPPTSPQTKTEEIQ